MASSELRHQYSFEFRCAHCDKFTTADKRHPLGRLSHEYHACPDCLFHQLKREIMSDEQEQIADHDEELCDLIADHDDREEEDDDGADG